MEQINLCPKCGGKLILENGYYKCEYCDGVFDAKKQDSIEDAIKKALDEEKQEHVANIRRLLWEATHAEYLSSEAILKHARDLRTYLPDDLQACFYETANQKNEKLINDFLNQIDVEDNYYIMDVIIDYMIKTMDKANFLVVSNLIEKTYAKKDLNLYNDFVSRASDMMNKIDSGTYDLNLERDCFIAYSSKDIDKVMELVYKLENSGLSCFVALRNLRHGKGAVENYEDAIKKAIDNTKVLVFVSSVNSRSQACDAFKFELPYIKTKDIQNAPAEYRFDYEKIPDKYKKPRVQYLIDPVSNTPNDRIIQQIMGKKEWRYDADQVCSSVINLINNPVIDEDEEKNKISDALKELEDLKKEIAKQNKQAKIVNGVDINARLEYCEILIADKKYEKAEKTIDEEVLKNDPKNPRAYILLTVIDFRLTKEEELATLRTSLTNNSNFNKALSFATGSYLEIVKGYNEAVLKNIKYDKDLAIFNQAMKLEDNKEYDKAISLFNTIKDFEGVKEEIEKCKYLLFELNTNKYNEANKYLEKYEYAKAIALFKELGDFQDSKERLLQATELQKKEQIYQKALIDTKGKDIGVFKNAISKLETIIDYRNSKELIEKYNNCILKLEKEKKKKKRNTLIFSLVSITAICICVIVAIYYVRVVVPTNNYNEAVSLMEQGRYNEARALFGEMGSFSDAKAQMDVVDAYEAFDNGDYESGIDHIYNAGGTINISYDANGGDIERTSQTIRKLSYVNNTVNKAGYTFYGWTITTYSIDNTKDNISCDLSLKASYDLISYDIIYELNGGMVSDALISTYTITDEVSLVSPTKKGYTFVGWKEKKSNEFIPNNVISAGNYGRIELDAVYTPNEYVVTFDVNGGILNQATMKVIYDSTIEFPTPTLDNYIFIGWYIENEAFTNGSVWNLDHNATVKAEWTDVIYHINYNLDGGTATNKDSYIFKDTFNLSYPEKAGYDFVGWTGTGLNEITKDVVIPVGSSGDRSYVAHYTPTIYTISYVLNDGTSTNKATYTIEDEFVLASPTKVGYTFTGWTNTSISTPTKDVKINLGTTGDLSFTANYDANTYKISYDVSGGVISTNNQNVVYDSNITLIIPTRDYYDFDGWYLNNEKIESVLKYSYANDINLVAKWTPVNYTITYNLDGGVNNEENPSTYNVLSSDIELLIPTKDGYTFTGWFDSSNNKVTKITSGSHGDMVFSAYFGRNISFDSNGGNTIDGKVYRLGDTVNLPTPTKDDYDFLGWYYESDLVENGEWKYDEILTLKARWSSKLSDFTFIQSSGYYVISGYNGNDEIIYIPNNYKGFEVKIIESNAFKYGDAEEVIIPNGITTIRSNSFGLMSNLVRITIPKTVTLVDIESFYGSQKLVEVINKSSVDVSSYCIFAKQIISDEKDSKLLRTDDGFIIYADTSEVILLKYKGNEANLVLPDNITTISDYALKGNTAIESLVVQNGVTSIGKEVISGCTSLIEITLPDTITSIGQNALACHSILTANVPASAIGKVFSNAIKTVNITGGTAIPNSALSGRELLETVNICDGVTSIGNAAFAGCQNLTNVTIPNSVTSIGSNAFDGCSKLASIALPNALTEIKDSTFYDCTALTSITIPNTVTIINNDVFRGCTNLATVNLPTTLTKIGMRAFYNCESLENITFPSTLNIVDSEAFRNCTSLSRIDSPSIEAWCNITFSGAFANPLNIVHNLYINNELVTTLVIPNTVEAINNYAFYGFTTLTSVTFSNTVTTIGSNAFTGCISLSSISIPESVTSIGGYAFDNCTGITEVSIANNSVTLGSYVFRNVEVEEATIPGQAIKLIKNDALREVHITGGAIPESAFSSCENLTLVDISETVTAIGTYAFHYCENLTSLVIPNSVNSIGESAFANCSSLEYLEVPFIGAKRYQPTDTHQYPLGYFFGDFDPNNSVITTQYYHGSSLINLTNKVYHIPSSLKEVVVTDCSYIAYGAFCNCKNITDITICSSVTEISESALMGCSGLRKISLPFIGNKSVQPNEGNKYESLGYIFGSEECDGCTLTEQRYYNSNTSSYTSVNYYIPSRLNTVVTTSGTSIGQYAFYNCKSLIEVVVSDTMTSLDAYAFRDCFNLAKITIGSSVASIDNNAFAHTDLFTYKIVEVVNKSSLNIIANSSSYGKVAFNAKQVITNDEDSKLSITEDGFMLYTDNNEVDLINYIGNSTGPVIPDNVTTIHNFAFCYKTNLITVTIPNSVTSIKNYAFYKCTLNRTEIPSSITVLNESVFNGCTSLNQVTLPNTLTKIGNYAFNNCTGLKRINSGTDGKFILPDSVTSLGHYSFSGCSNLVSIRMSNSVSSIGYYAFSNCTSLTKFNSENDGEFVLPSSLTIISSGLFSGCTGLTTISIHNGVTSIGASAFYNCTSLISVTIPNTVTNIEQNVFKNCTSLKKINSANDGEVLLPSGLTTIRNEAFKDCTLLTEVLIPDTVTTIGERAFSGCSSLQKITLPFVGGSVYNEDTADQYPLGYIFGGSSYTGAVATTQKCFHNSSSTSIVYYIPSTLTEVVVTNTDYIQYGAFSNCANLTSVTIPGDAFVEPFAFDGCSATKYYCSTITYNDSEYKLIWTVPSNPNVTIGITRLNIPDGMENSYLPILSFNGPYQFNGWKDSSSHFVTDGSGLINTAYLTSPEIMLTAAYGMISITPSKTDTHYTFDVDALNAYKNAGYTKVRVTINLTSNYIYMAGYTENLTLTFKYDVGESASTYFGVPIHGDYTGEFEPGEGEVYAYSISGNNYFDIPINDLINNLSHMLTIQRTDYYKSAFPTTISFSVIK